MNKSELINAIAARSGVSRKIVEQVFSALIEVIKDTLRRGEKIRLVGILLIEVVQRAAKKGRNPRTGVEINIPATKQIRFKSGKQLKDAVNQ
ncbi:transcriptional regulator [Rickettsiales bacterium]|nr:transcriptional regulator [Rickettsiales bacterium]